MKVTNLTLGQREVLLSSLRKQKREGRMIEGSSEDKVYRELLREAVREVSSEDGSYIFEVNGSGTHARVADKFFDTFGEDYRRRWMKIKESTKGCYIMCSYYSVSGSKRIYLDI